MKFTPVVAAAAVLCSSVLFAQDIEKKQFRIVVDGDNQPGVARLLQLSNNQLTSKYWIGVMATPAGDTVKAQLRLENGLSVEQVVDEGPAKAAGVKKHDILIKYNDHALTDIETLMKAVDESKGKKSEITILRGGSEKKLKITAKERPKSDHPLTMEWKANPQGWWMSRAPQNRMMLFGPGMKLLPGQDLKDLNVEVEVFQDDEGGDKQQMSITIKRQNDKPAQITVKKNGETYEVTEDKLDKLPAKVRAAVKKHLEGNQQNQFKHLQWRRPEIRLDLPGAHLDHGKFEERMQKMMQRMEELLKEVEELKKDRRRAPRNRQEETVDA